MFNCDDEVDVTLVEYSDECVGWVTAVAEVDAAAGLDDVNVERMILAAVGEVTFVEFQGEVPL